MKTFRSLYKISYYANASLESSIPSFQHSDLTITRTQNYIARPPTDAKVMTFGSFHTDHMLTVDWTEKKGWGKPSIGPFQNLSIHPFASSLHYAIQCFEGSKAYKTTSGQLRLFRLDCNMFRMKQTAMRLSLPDFDGKELLKCIADLIRVDQDWIPTEQGFAAYLRPTFIATEETLGVRAPTKAKLFVCISPVGPYFPTGFNPVKVYCNTKHIRAAPGGCGGFKVGANYAPTIQPQKQVQAMGFAQSLWMLHDGLIQEMGVCNLFIYWTNKDGEKELITPELDGTILPGVIRDSVLSLCREEGKFKVTERKIYINELVEAFNEGRVLEMFGSGTAVNIQPIEAIGYKDQLYTLKINPQLGSGELAYRLNQELSIIQQSDKPHKWVQIV